MSDGHLLLWLDLHRQSYFWLVGSLLIAATAWAIGPILRGRPDESGGHDWWWGLVILGLLLAGRWPTFLITREFNPDESQLLAGARALLDDPVFWRAVNGGTAGPLDFFALWPAGLIFGWKTYTAARLTALLLLTAALTLAHQSLALACGQRVARLAGLGVVGLEALTDSTDLLSYSTELLPMALLAAATYAAVRRWLHQGGAGWNALGGLLLGAIPLAKLQAIPLAGALGLGWLIAEFCTTLPDASRRRLYLAAGALVPSALFASQITAAGEWGNVILCYFYSNRHYTAAVQLTFSQLADLTLMNFVNQKSLLQLWLPGMFVSLALLFRPRWPESKAARIVTVAGAAACALALGCIVLPRRPFVHYWQLLMVPVTFLLGGLLANLLPRIQGWRRRDQWLVAVCCAGVLGTLLQERFRKPNTYIGAFTYFAEHPRTDLAARAAAQGRPGDRLGLWGWSAYVYVEADMIQATRDGNFSGAILPGPYREYFRQLFLVDLRHTLPPLFVDSSGPCSPTSPAPELAHDRCFPELAEVIRANYVLVDEITGARIYRRRDLAER